jgi:hypothetical protein
LRAGRRLVWAVSGAARRQYAVTAGAAQMNSSDWSVVNDDGGEGKGGAERDPAAELEVTAVERAVELEVATLALDSHRPRESTAREMRDAIAHDC